MGRPKLGAEYKKSSDYNYDYPENREINKYLGPEDRTMISIRTGFSRGYVVQWCKGLRRSRRIEELARQIMRLNISKQKRLEKLTISNN